MRTRSVPSHALTIIAVSLFVACGDDPATVKPSPPATSRFAGIEIVGPDSFFGSAQLVAKIRQADGTTKSAMSMPGLTWRSSNPSVISVSSSGFVSEPDSVFGESGYGEAVITAELTGPPAVRGTREIVLQPEGTYRLIGSVRESDAPHAPIAGARVEVLSGSNFTFTDVAGRYRLYGVPPQSTIRITAAGYETLDEPVQIAANVSRDFGVKLNGPRPAPTGPYTLSASAYVVSPGSPLSVSWVAPSGRSIYDWIAIYKVGSSDFAYDEIWWSYTQGSSAGTFTISAPAQPGLYEFRYFSDDGFEVAAKSSVIEVTTATVALFAPFTDLR